VVNSGGSTEELPTVVSAFGEAAGANLQVRPIASAAAPELIATSAAATPVPEPGGAVQILSGLLGLGLLCRRRRCR
jgi:hypothetical protein